MHLAENGEKSPFNSYITNKTIKQSTEIQGFKSAIQFKLWLLNNY